MKRHQNDNIENNRKVLVGDEKTQEFKKKLWRDVHVGMIVKIECDQLFPADLILLNSSAHKGICYIETKNLDGETNLKHKTACKEVIELCQDDKKVLQNMKGVDIECENPNEILYKFEG